jgi:4-cresol dehydrogenase (hydroxylating)
MHKRHSINTEDRHDAVIAGFAQIVGGSHVDGTQPALNRAAQATFATSNRPSAIVSPADAGELRECLRLASRMGRAVYPISCGRNWGYGSRVPFVDEAVILSLHRMDRILDFDDGLGTITIEPGVTFARLREFLKARGSRRHLNPPGSGAHASVIGNTLERGLSVGLRPDRHRDVTSLVALLANGEQITTGIGGIRAERAGPSLDGLFFQSRLAVVSAMTISLPQRPEHALRAGFSLLRWQDLGAVVRPLRQLMQEGSIATSIAIHSGDKLSTLAGCRGVSRADVAVAHWYGEFAIGGGSAAIVQALRERVEEILSPVVQPDWSSHEDAMALFGQPAQCDPRQAYWRKPPDVKPRDDPDRDRCGVIFHAPVVPMDGASFMDCARLAGDCLASRGYDRAITFHMLDGRAAAASIAILYDRDVEGSDRQAQDCLDELDRVLSARGYAAYRTGLQHSQKSSENGTAAQALLEAIRAHCDPVGIMPPDN